ncbi:MAG: PEP-CTERM sorting domain-containing protein [Chthonomonas sp.]|nr:PEP-CTERM sorting domain-containing protein [Chthonomonas sp.]
MKKQFLVMACLAVASVQVASAAITFSNVMVNGNALAAGVPLSSANPFIDQTTYNIPVMGGNSISFSTPNAIVGDGSPTAADSMNLTYVAASGPAMVAVNAFSNIGAPALGSGMVVFTETVYSYNLMTMTVGGILGSISHTFNSMSSPNFSGTISLSTPANAIYVVKNFQLSAPNSPAFDLAAVAVNNQSIEVVPEPAGIAAIALGAGMLLRRRTK